MMQIDMVDRFLKWIFHFMKTYQWLDKYNAIWLAVPAYHDLTPKISPLKRLLNGIRSRCKK